VVVQGHGVRQRQLWGPTTPGAAPELVVVAVRRFRCILCRAVSTVAPAEALTARLYTASAIAWSLALYGLSALSTAAIRELVSPLRIVGPASATRWLTVRRWCTAVVGGRLFTESAGHARSKRDDRAVAEAAAAAIAAHALPSPEPPPLTSLAFFGAARAA
jgi:hypothetical protein